MSLAVGVLPGAGIAAALAPAWKVIRASRLAALAETGMQSALHAASSTLPHLRRGPPSRTAEQAVPHLRALTGC